MSSVNFMVLVKTLISSDIFFFRYVTQFNINIGVTQETTSLLYNKRLDILLFIAFNCSSEVVTLLYNELCL